MAELIADCERLPESIRPPEPPPGRIGDWQEGQPPDALPWAVGEDCVVCVAGLDEYGC